MFAFYVVLRCNKKLKKVPKSENFRAVHNRGPDGKLWIAGAHTINQSDVRIWDSGTAGKLEKEIIKKK